MNDILTNNYNKNPTNIADLFKVLDNENFYISSDSIMIRNSVLVKNRVYLVVEFLDNGEIKHYPIKMLHAYRKGFHVLIFGMDLTTNEFIYKKLRLDADSVKCDWLIVEIDFFDDNQLFENLNKFDLKNKLVRGWRSAQLIL